MRRIATIIGTRPQFIKASAISRVIDKTPAIEEVIIHTGQHYDNNMSEIFFRELKIPKPEYNLNVSGISHGAMTGRMLEEVEAVLKTIRPDAVLVYGDTNSTLAGALGASKIHIPVAHVEAGLRSNNPFMPEELNRVITDRVSSFLFCPTDISLKNLEIEGFPFPSVSGEHQRLTKSGDVMKDVALHYGHIALAEIDLADVGILNEKYVVVTLHRQENVDCDFTLRNILQALEKLSRDINVVVPMHPRLAKRLKDMDFQLHKAGMIAVDPLSYLQMQRVLMSAALLITDSGGLQKEAFFHGIPCVTLRTETEWPETLASGRNCLINPESDLLAEQIQNWSPSERGVDEGIFGDGHAAKHIIHSLVQFM